MGAMNHTKSRITWKRKIGMNWNFENKLFLFLSSDLCHKMITVRITHYSFNEKLCSILDSILTDLLKQYADEIN